MEFLIDVRFKRINELEIARQKEGSRLKTLRSEMGLTIRELAKEFNVAFSSISQWENGNHTIPGSVLKLVEIYEEKLKKSTRG